MRRRALFGLALCTAVMAAAYPLLLGIEAYPREVFFGDDVYSVTPATANRLNESFAFSVAAQSWSVTVSPEVYVFSSWGGAPVIARGVDPPAFLAIEGGRLLSGSLDGDRFALVGEDFASRRGLEVGSAGILAGSMTSGIESVTVTGIFSSPGPSTDEVLIPLTTSRKLAALGVNELSAIRLRTSDSTAMMRFLEATGLSIAVGSNGGTVYLNTPFGGGDRLSSLIFLYPELRSELGRSYVSGFAQQGANGVRLVVFAFMFLLTLLVVAGIYSVVWRATAEASKNIGILKVVGARESFVLGSLLKEFLVAGLVAILCGLVAGEIVASLAGTYGVLVVFSHTIRPEFDIVLALLVLAIAVLSTSLSCLLCGSSSFGRRPRDLISQTEPRREELPQEAIQL